MSRDRHLRQPPAEAYPRRRSLIGQELCRLKESETNEMELDKVNEVRAPLFHETTKMR